MYVCVWAFTITLQIYESNLTIIICVSVPLQSHQVLVFMPENNLQYGVVGDHRRCGKAGFDVNPTKITSEIEILEDLQAEGLLKTTPPQDYDDSYIIQYAQAHNGFIVSNDKYRDSIEKKEKEFDEIAEKMKEKVKALKKEREEFVKLEDHNYRKKWKERDAVIQQKIEQKYKEIQEIEKEKKQTRRLMKKFLKSHLISFAFVGDEFLQNPDFVFRDEEEESKDQET